jgi:hypothetical protein
MGKSTPCGALPHKTDRAGSFERWGEGEFGHFEGGLEHVQSEIATSEVKIVAAR